MANIPPDSLPFSFRLKLYENHADGKATGLKRPLLSYSPASQFTFAKCHFETNVPHDPFAAQLLETERFPRYARMWTRGYDVYTPSDNIVYSESINLHPLHHTAGHGSNGERKWPPNDSERHDSQYDFHLYIAVSFFAYYVLNTMSLILSR